MYKHLHDFKNDGHEPFSIIVFAIISMSLLILFSGISGIIEHKSPENMASLATLGAGFITHLEYHALIIFGAFGITLAAWISRHRSQ